MQLNKKNTRVIFSFIIFAAVLLWVTQYFDKVTGFVSFIFSILFPFILGCGIAFVINVLLDQLEGLYTKFIPKNDLSEKLKRPISLVLSIIIILGILFLLLFLIVPEVINSIKMVISNFPDYMNTIKQSYLGFVEKTQWTFLPEWKFELDWENLTKEGTQWLTNYGQSILSNSLSAANTLMSTMVTFFLAIVFSIYVLMQKESLGKQVNKALYAFLSPTWVYKIKHVGEISSKTFGNFVTGQLLECAILGVVCFTGMMIMKIPYAPMISALVAFGALIPVFGAFIATLLGAMLIMLVNPMQALIFIIFIVVYQQIDGNIIYPRIVGNSVGLPGIWVLVAVALGGNVGGMFGMLLGVPVFSVLYALFRESVYKRLVKKDLVNKDLELEPDKLVLSEGNVVRTSDLLKVKDKEVKEK